MFKTLNLSHLNWRRLRHGKRQFDVDFHHETNNRLYQYEKLGRKSSIRLLCLQAAHSANSELRSSLVISRLNDAEYEAVSYTWGDPIFSELLYVDGGHINITKNLSSALHQFRYPDRPRWLWVDAVCINQADDVEKGSQVALMPEIYYKARRVLCWLGEGTEETGAAMRYLADLAASAEDFGRETEVLGALFIQPPELRCDEGKIVDMMQTQKKYHLHKIYTRDWFSRLWVIQEVSLAKEAIISCGSDELDWKRFAAAMVLLLGAANKLGWKGIEEKNAFMFAWALVEVRARHYGQWKDGKHIFYTQQYSEFGYLMYAFPNNGCKDARDRIYALMSLKAHDSDYFIEPDYRKSVSQVYTQFALSQLQRKSIEVLYHAGIWNRKTMTDIVTTCTQSTMDYLPSWVPELRQSHLTASSLPWSDVDFRMTLGAGFCPQAKWSNKNPHHVTLRGFLWATVRHLESPEVREQAQMLSFDTVRNFIHRCQASVLHLSAFGSYPFGGSYQEAFANTLVAGGTGKVFKQLFGGNNNSADFFQRLWYVYVVHCNNQGGDIISRRAEWESEDFDEENFRNSLSAYAYAAWYYYKFLSASLPSVQFLVTSGNRIGLVSQATRVGDVIAILDGSHIPCVLRKVEGTEEFLLVGTCYVHGLMDAGIEAGPWTDVTLT